MEEKSVSGSFIVISEENSGSLYPIFIGVSCAFFALRLLPEPEIRDDRWSELRNRMLRGGALLGLLVSAVERNVAASEKSKLLEKLARAEMEIAELKKRRSEDAKANEKVVSIFAAREQSWFEERRKLSHQINALTNELRVVEAKKGRSVSELCEKMKETEVILQLKDNMIEEAERRRLESEEKLKAAENQAAEFRENLKSEKERHSSEISKHKTAFIELVSNQRQLEAEMGRTLKQIEAAKKELEEKEEMVLMNQRLSVEIVRMHKEFERKSRLEMAEKQMLLKEVKSLKAKRKQAEVEAVRWKAISESKHDRISLKNLFLKHVNGYKNQEMRKGVELLSFVSDPFLTNGTQELRKYEEKLGIDAFMVQLRQKDEKLEAYNWRLMSADLESRRLQSHIEALDREIAQLKQQNFKLEGILLDRESKLEQVILRFAPQNHQKPSFDPPPLHDAALHDDTVWSRVKVVKRKPACTRQEMKGVDELVEKYKEDEDIVLTLEHPNKEMKQGKHSSTDHIRHERNGPEDVEGQSSSKISSSTSTLPWKMDVHALGVSYKVKRLKQQLLVLERLIEKEEVNSENERVKGLYELISFLNKQVDRYNSLQFKIDQLCMRMEENKANSKSGVSTTARAEEETKRMEHFLEETFQLQRYIVATGQKSMEVQSKIAANLVAEVQDIERHRSFEVERFGESLRTLFRETQRGLEVRISRIIGDLEGTLARDGFNSWRKL